MMKLTVFKILIEVNSPKSINFTIIGSSNQGNTLIEVEEYNSALIFIKFEILYDKTYLLGRERNDHISSKNTYHDPSYSEEENSILEYSF